MYLQWISSSFHSCSVSDQSSWYGSTVRGYEIHCHHRYTPWDLYLLLTRHMKRMWEKTPQVMMIQIWVRRSWKKLACFCWGMLWQTPNRPWQLQFFLGFFDSAFQFLELNSQYDFIAIACCQWWIVTGFRTSWTMMMPPSFQTRTAWSCSSMLAWWVLFSTLPTSAVFNFPERF